MQFCRFVVGFAAAASLLGAAACNQSNLVSAPTPAPTPAPVTDTFTTTQSGGQSDILFVVNNTDDSMKFKAGVLGSSATAFIQYLVSQDVDFHIGVTSMDMQTTDSSCTDVVGSLGCLGGNPKVIDKNTPNLLATFQANLYVGNNGDSQEFGIDAALAAVTAPLVTGGNAGFLRPTAKLYVVFVSDEDDNATLPGCANSFSGSCLTGSFSPTTYVTAFANAKGGAANFVSLSAIVGPAGSNNPPGEQNPGCNNGSGSSSDPTSTGADPGTEYLALISASNGLFESMCDPGYSSFLNNLGFQVGAPQSVYVLTKTPSNPSTIVVKVNGATVPSTDWTYSASNNTVTFISSAVPPSGASVTITYDI